MKIVILLLLTVTLCLPAMADDTGPAVTKFDNGVSIICRTEPSANLVAITVFVQAGSAEENLSDAGIGSMVADTILTGTTNQNSDSIATSIGSVGGNVKAIWEPDVTQIRALVLPSQFDDAAYLLSDVLKNADFPESSLEVARQDLLSRIQARTDDIFDSTNDRLRSSLYAGTPYALPQIGTVQTIKKLTRDDLIEYFDRFYRPDNILISVVGNIDSKTVLTAFSDDLSDFVRQPTRHVAPLVVPNLLNAADPIVLKNYRSDVTAGLLMAGYLAPGVDSPDYPAMIVTNALLGGMKTSLMFKNLRMKKQYGYEVASNYTTQIGLSDETGYILYPVTTPGNDGKPGPDQTPIVKEALLAQFKALVNDPVSDTDLLRAKRFVIGSYLLAHERIEDRSYYLGYSALAMKHLGGAAFDSGYSDNINAVTAADVQKVAKKYFSGAPVISLLLPGSATVGVQND